VARALEIQFVRNSAGEKVSPIPNIELDGICISHDMPVGSYVPEQVRIDRSSGKYSD
jgi:hypothetical protein